MEEVQAPMNLHGLRGSQELKLVLVPSQHGCSDSIPSLLLHQHSVSFHMGRWRLSSYRTPGVKYELLILTQT